MISALMAAGAAAGAAAVLDRVAVVAGKEVITERELLEQIRLTAFLNGENPDLGPQARRKAAEELIDQSLIRQSMTISHYPPPEAAEADKMLAELKKTRFFNRDAAYRQALSKYGISEKELKTHLLWQLTALRFTDFMFRPGAPTATEALRQQLEQRTQTRARERANAPLRNTEPRNAAEANASERQQTGAEGAELSVDQQLDLWLKQARRDTRIVYRQEAFQ